MRSLQSTAPEEVPARAKELRAPVDLVRYVAQHGRLPVPNFAAGGIATPADAALCMALGAEAVFVGSGIFKSEDPAVRAKACVHATTHWKDPAEVLAASRKLGKAMEGLAMETLAEHERLATRGW
jgi:pyridoxal 5'-phosphate synthase pdxS subunit